MQTHPLSIFRVDSQRRSNTAELPKEGNFFRGFLFAIAISIPIWVLIIWGVHELFH